MNLRKVLEKELKNVEESMNCEIIGGKSTSIVYNRLDSQKNTIEWVLSLIVKKGNVRNYNCKYCEGTGRVYVMTSDGSNEYIGCPVCN